MSSVKSDVPSLAVQFAANQTPGSRVEQLGASSWRLSLPSGPAGQYRLAQIDDYTRLVRSKFPWRPPLALSLRARASAPVVPGTWGFGFWNDPFSLSMGFSGGVRRFPALPNAAWFFIASPPNYLSLRDDLPAQGALAAAFRSPHLPVPLLALGAFIFPLFFWRFSAQWLRRMGRRLIQQDAVALSLDLTQWHLYRLTWLLEETAFFVDGACVLKTKVSPQPPLGLVIWIDNQFAALPPKGRLSFGTLPNPQAAWIEVEHIELDHQEV